MFYSWSRKISQLIRFEHYSSDKNNRGAVRNAADSGKLVRI